MNKQTIKVSSVKETLQERYNLYIKGFENNKRSAEYRDKAWHQADVIRNLVMDLNINIKVSGGY